MSTIDPPFPMTQISITGLNHLKFEYLDGEYVVTLIDSSRHELLKGYGTTIIDAINDLHQNLL